MKYILIFLLLSGCVARTVKIIEVEKPVVKYFPEGSQGSTIPYFYSGEGKICSKTGEIAYYFKMTNTGEVIDSQYYADNLKHK